MAWAPDYVTGNELKSYFNIQHDEDDTWLDIWATTVSRNVDDFCSRQFGQVEAAETRKYKGKYDAYERRTYFEIDDLQDLTGFAVTDEDGSSYTDYEFEPDNALLKGRPYTVISIEGKYESKFNFLGKWGWTTVPSSVKTGIYLQANRLKARRNSPFGIAGSPEDGSEIRLLAQLDPDFKTSLKPYVRKWYVR